MAYSTAEPTRWSAVALVLGAGIVAAFQIGKLPASLPLLRAELELSLFAAGWVISAIAGVGACAGLLSGLIADRLGHRRVLLAGLALLGLGGVAGAAADGGAALLLTRVAEGVGYTAIITAGPTLLTRLTRPADRGVALGIWAFYLPLGLSGMVLATPVLLDVVSWRGVWLVNAGLAALALALVAVTIPAAPVPSREGPGVSLVHALTATALRPGPVALAVCFAAYSLIHLAVVAFLPTFLIEKQGVTLDQAARMTALAMFMNAPGCLLGGLLVKRGYPCWALIAAGYVLMAAASLVIFSDSFPGDIRFAAAAFLTFTGGLIPASVLVRAPAHAASPALVATIMGLIVQFISLGQFLGPPVLAALVSWRDDWSDATILTLGASAIGLGAAALLRRLDAGLAEPAAG